MHSMGLEPTPGNPDMNLNHARMPIPPQVHLQIKSATLDIISTDRKEINLFLKKILSKLKKIVFGGFYDFYLDKSREMIIIYNMNIIRKGICESIVVG